MIIDRSLLTRFSTFSSFDDFFSPDDDFSADEVFSRYSENECDLLIRECRSKVVSWVMAAVRLAACSFALRFSGLTSFSETVHSPLPSTIGSSSRYKSHLPSGLSLPTWCGQSMSTSTYGARHGPSLLICLTVLFRNFFEKFKLVLPGKCEPPKFRCRRNFASHFRP